MKALLTSLICVGFITSVAYATEDVNHLEIGAGHYSHPNETQPSRFHALENSLRTLKKHFGPHGKIYLNDLQPEGLALAMKFARQWLDENGRASVELVSWPGDIFSIPLPEVRTAFLNHPDPKVLTSMPRLLKVADTSQSGLRIVSTFPETVLQMTAVPEIRNRFFDTGSEGFPYYDYQGRKLKLPSHAYYLMPAKRQICEVLLEF